ncbi:MAG: hypothetical protein V1913_07110 [Fibrobacterota bacterium]
MLINTFLILFLFCLALFLFQIAVQFIKLERKLELTAEVLEGELIDVFGTSPAAEAEKETAKKEDKPAMPPLPSPAAKLAAAAKSAEAPKKGPSKPAKGRK